MIIWNIWVQLAMLATGMMGYLVYTVVCCFWFIYLVDAINRKRRFYKTTLKCIERESDPYQEMLAYNAKTELVKFVSLFCLNLLEWIGVTFMGISLLSHIVVDYQQQFPINHTLAVPGEWNSKLDNPNIDNTCIIIHMTIIGSLCMYLSARYAHKSWITLNRIPYWICFFLLSTIAAQILLIICYTHIIGIWCERILVAISVVFAWKQYRKLDMVIQWSIVDLRVSGNIELLEKQVSMKRRFNRIFTTIWIGISCMLVANLIYLISLTTPFILRMYNHSFIDSFLCGAPSSSYLDSFTVSLFYSMEVFISLLGIIIIIFPYIGYGLSTMFVILFRGKTGYRTHFPGQLTAPLV